VTSRRGPSQKQVIDTINLAPIEAKLKPHYDKWKPGDGNPGRTPTNPVGLVLSMVIQLLRGDTREDLIAFLERHDEWVRWLGFDTVPDHSTWSKLLDRIPVDVLEEIVHGIVHDLKQEGLIRQGTLAVDGSFLAAGHWDQEATWRYARPSDDRAMPYGLYKAFNDESDEVPLAACRDEDTTVLGYGYRIHAIVDVRNKLPVAVHVTRAHNNDVGTWPTLFEIAKAGDAVDWTRVGYLVGDRAYDSATVRGSFDTHTTCVVTPPANTPEDLPEASLSDELSEVYEERTSVERFFSRVKSVASLARWGVTGLERVRKWVLLACIGVLLAGWANHEHGRDVGSVPQFVRMTR